MQNHTQLDKLMFLTERGRESEKHKPCELEFMTEVNDHNKKNRKNSFRQQDKIV